MRAFGDEEAGLGRRCSRGPRCGRLGVLRARGRGGHPSGAAEPTGAGAGGPGGEAGEGWAEIGPGRRCTPLSARTGGKRHNLQVVRAGATASAVGRGPAAPGSSPGTAERGSLVPGWPHSGKEVVGSSGGMGSLCKGLVLRSGDSKNAGRCSGGVQVESPCLWDFFSSVFRAEAHTLVVYSGGDRCVQVWAEREVRRAEAWSVCRGGRLVVPGASGNGVVELWLEGENTGDGWVVGRYRAGREPGRCSLRDRRWFQALVAWYQNCRLFCRVGLKVRFVL